jgi:hypothetical protein
MASYELNGRLYRSYKHPILEYILDKALEQSQEPPDEIPFSYEDVRQAMTALEITRYKQASLSNFTIDLLRRANTHEQRVPPSVWERGYDLARAPDRVARQGIAGRLIRKELRPKDPWIVWSDITEENIIIVPNNVPIQVRPFLGNDEGALLSVMDYCDVLSFAINGEPETILRVQHPKKWQPGEVDGLYFSDYEDVPMLYPVEAKALSTNDNVNLEQVQGSYNTMIGKIKNIKIAPLAVQMIPDGMYIATFEATETGELIISSSLMVKIDPPIETWRGKGKKALANQLPLL